ncbi:hypothetical protein IVA95_15340 [Bradyrhizobium sp. 157]|uniref:hypothetical protein n=1 Tax=Bradyrhizobium sp. 157 TaxID=2782631 RepID=UPI001FFB04E6|nr:hypothetical protein [Bradyrhizobium sp. 157]MCK1638939.1 hypothetical protein [Bradyrhizobium sp. 157]
MVDHFESPKRTIQRAKHHIDDLERHVIAFTASNTWTHVVDLDADGFHHLHKIRWSRSLPDDLPSILFDAVNNLRSALDQCGYACAMAAKNKSTKHIKFPFAKDETHFLRALPGCCKDLPAEIIALFRSYNAYKGGNDVLWALNELCNTKKHFSLVPMTAGRAILRIIPTAEHPLASKARPTAEHLAKGVSPAGFYGLVGGNVSPRDPRWDASRNELLLLRTDPKKHVNHDANVSPTVSIEGIDFLRHKPAVGVLKQMLNAVAAVGEATESECRRLGLI